MIRHTGRTAYIVRRQMTGGGAEGAANRLADHLAPDWSVHRLGAGMRFHDQVIAGAKGPGWWRGMRFAGSVDGLLKGRPGVILNLERGPDCDIYRAGDGVHLHWRALRFGSSPAWMANPLHWLYPRLEAKTIRSARFVATNSEMVRREMEQYYPWAASKLRVVPNGFDPELFFPTTLQAPVRADDPDLSAAGKLFLFVGSGWRRKGLSRALEFLAGYNQALGPDEPRGRLCVIGKGRPETVAALIRRLRLAPLVRFLGSRTDLRRFYQAADFLILPTRYDPFANVCLEAMACGCPVITTRNNGAAEVIEHGRTGYILEEDLREAIQWCATVAPRRPEIAQSVAGLTVGREMQAFSDLMEACLA